MTAIHRAVQYIRQEAWPVWRRERNRWKDMASYDTVKVFYGYDSIADQEQVLHGGIVKVQDLIRFFPNHNRDANVLYLVSSALPQFGPGFVGKFLPSLAILMVQYAKKAGVKVVLNQDGVAYQGWYGKGWERANRQYRELVHSVDHVFYQSEFAKMSADRFLGERSGAWSILNNAVDTTVFRPADVRGDRPFTILVTGSHYTIERVASALRTLQELREAGENVVLTVAGRFCWSTDASAAQQEFDMLCDELGVSDWVSFLGTYTQSQAVALFQSADVLLHMKYNDPCPRVVIEALACGVPVVYSDSGGVPELVGKNGGVGVPVPLDWEREHFPKANALASAVLTVQSDFEQMSAAARARAEAGLDLKPWVAEHADLFDRLVREGGAE